MSRARARLWISGGIDGETDGDLYVANGYLIIGEMCVMIAEKGVRAGDLGCNGREGRWLSYYVEQMKVFGHSCLRNVSGAVFMSDGLVIWKKDLEESYFICFARDRL